MVEGLRLNHANLYNLYVIVHFTFYLNPIQKLVTKRMERALIVSLKLYRNFGTQELRITSSSLPNIE